MAMFKGGEPTTRREQKRLERQRKLIARLDAAVARRRRATRERQATRLLRSEKAKASTE